MIHLLSEFANPLMVCSSPRPVAKHEMTLNASAMRMRPGRWGHSVPTETAEYQYGDGEAQRCRPFHPPLG